MSNLPRSSGLEYSTNMATLFNSTGNNFGAGQIAFKSHQEQNFVVLNAKFTYNPENADYQAADVLEIYVPDLSIDRSAISGVFLRFRDVRDSYGYTWDNSGGTVLKSWVKDKNTLCIEKLTNFDEKGEITIYILTLYTMLARGAAPIKGTMTRLQTTSENNYLRWRNESFFVEFEHWIFLNMLYSSCTYAYRDSTWECSLDNLPSGITADLPFCGGGNQYNPSVDGMSEAHIENGVFTCATRTAGFDDTGHDPFIFAFLVRDDVPVQTEGNGNIDLPGGDDH